MPQVGLPQTSRHNAVQCIKKDAYFLQVLQLAHVCQL